MQTDVMIVETTLDDIDKARSMAHQLIEERLAACIQIAPVHSTYRWQGAIEQTEEWLLRIKTTANCLAGLCQRIQELHSYDTPEILWYPAAANSQYRAWMTQETTQEAWDD